MSNLIGIGSKLIVIGTKIERDMDPNRWRYGSTLKGIGIKIDGDMEHNR